MPHIDDIKIILNIKKKKYIYKKHKEKEKIEKQNKKSIYNSFYTWIKYLFRNKKNINK